MTTPAEEAWAVYGVELPEAFIFPVTRLGLTADVHGAGSFVGKAPLRVDCHVHFDAARLEILSSLNPHTGAELAVGTEFEEQFSLALWLYNKAPCGIVPMPSGGRSTHTFRRALALGGRDTMANTSKTWSLRERALED